MTRAGISEIISCETTTMHLPFTISEGLAILTTEIHVRSFNSMRLEKLLLSDVNNSYSAFGSDCEYVHSLPLLFIVNAFGLLSETDAAKEGEDDDDGEEGDGIKIANNSTNAIPTASPTMTGPRLFFILYRIPPACRLFANNNDTLQAKLLLPPRQERLQPPKEPDGTFRIRWQTRDLLMQGRLLQH